MVSMACRMAQENGYSFTGTGGSNHTWGAGVVTTPATTTSEGVTTYTCTSSFQTFQSPSVLHKARYFTLPVAMGLLVTFQVGVRYGTDIEEARQVILDALKPLIGKDKYGREVVDKRRGIMVRVINFGDSSVDLTVLLYTTVETYRSLPGQAREAIYNAFNENGIEIPFPQVDVHVKDTPEQHA